MVVDYKFCLGVGMSISKKIWAMVGLSLLTCALVSGFGALGLRHLNVSLLHVTTQSVPGLLQVNDMRTAYLGLIPKVYALATAADEAQRNTLDKTVKEEIARLVDRINAYSERITDVNDKAVSTKPKWRWSVLLASYVRSVRWPGSVSRRWRWR